MSGSYRSNYLILHHSLSEPKLYQMNPLDLYPTPEVPRCELVGGWFGISLQIAIGVLAFLTLIVKRCSERPMRSWAVFARDSSKQAIGATYGHFVNLSLAILVPNSDPCVWYFLNYILDIAVGVGLLYCGILITNMISIRFNIPSLRSGNYGYPPSVLKWFIQLLIWLLIITIVKVLIVWYENVFYVISNCSFFKLFIVFSN